jgi:hypothetical protein
MFSPRTSESACWPSESIYIKTGNQNNLSIKTNKSKCSIAERRAAVERTSLTSFI